MKVIAQEFLGQPPSPLDIPKDNKVLDMYHSSTNNQYRNLFSRTEKSSIQMPTPTPWK